MFGALRQLWLWCVGEDLMPTLMIDPAPRRIEVVAPAQSELEVATEQKSDAAQRQAFLRLTSMAFSRMSCSVALNDKIHYCEAAERYLNGVGNDPWGILAMAFSIVHEWALNGGVHTEQDQVESMLAAILCVCMKFQCGEQVTSMTYRAVQITPEVSVLGAVLLYAPLEWYEKVFIHADKLHEKIAAKAMKLIIEGEIWRHGTRNAQALAEELLQFIYSGGNLADMHDLYKGLRALRPLYFASVYAGVPFLNDSTTHSVALVAASLFCGGYAHLVFEQPPDVHAHARAILTSVLDVSDVLPRLNDFDTGGSTPWDEWVTRRRVADVLGW
jgi:hypothetical protein